MSTQTDTVRYELMVIVSPEIGETAINNRLDAIRKSIKDFGGEIFFEDVWGLRNLAYTIRKQDQGYYAVMDVNFDPAQVKALERILRLEPEVLRHMFMRLPNVFQPKSLTDMEAELLVLMPPEEKKEEKKPYGGGFVRKTEVPREVKKEEKVEKAPVKEEKAVKEEAPKEPVKKAAEEAPKKSVKKKEESKKALEDIDAKLDSILSNPDINF